MNRKGAIIDESDKICSLGLSCSLVFTTTPVLRASRQLRSIVMQAQPHSSSAVHHHGEQDTMVYAAQGHGSIVFDGGKQQKDLQPGDFALIPAYDPGSLVSSVALGDYIVRLRVDADG